MTYMTRVTDFIAGSKIKAVDLDAEFDNVVSSFALVEADVDTAALSVTTAGSNTTSTTSNDIGTGPKTWTVQAGKSIVVGMTYKMSNTPSPTNWMLGTVTAYNSTTGSLTVSVTDINGSGTGLTQWTGSVSGPRSTSMVLRSVSSATTIVATDSGGIIDITAGTFTVSWTAAATLGANGGFWVYIRNSGTGTATHDFNASETCDGATTLTHYPGETRIFHCDGTSFRSILTNSLDIFSAGTQTMTGDVTLTSASARLQTVTSSSVGASIYLPDTGSIRPGVAFWIKNDGSLPVGVRKTSGTLLGAVAGGTTGKFTAKDASNNWQCEGHEPGLVTVDQTLSTTYSNATLVPYVNLDNNKSIHFATIAANGFAAFVVDSSGRAVGTPVAVETGASTTLNAAFLISSTSAIVFWSQSTNYRCAVLSVSGTTITLNTVATTTTNWMPGTAETMLGAQRILQLTTTLYLLLGTNSTTDATATVVSVSGTTCTIGTRGTAAVTNMVASSIQGYVASSTQAVVLYRTGASAPYDNVARIISVAGTTPTFGSAVSATGVQSTGASTIASTEALSTTKYVLADNHNTTTSVKAAALTADLGTNTVSWGSAITVASSLTGVSVVFGAAGHFGDSRYARGITMLSSSTALLSYEDSPGGSGDRSNSVVLSESGGTLTAGTILKGSPGAEVNSSTAGAGAVFPVSSSGWLGMTLMTGTNSVGVSAFRTSGTSVVEGAFRNLNKAAPITTVNDITGVRLSSGVHLLRAYGSGSTTSGDVVAARTDGYDVAMLGSIGLPLGDYGIANGYWAVPNLGTGTCYLYGARGSSGTSSEQLRIVRVEVAS